MVRLGINLLIPKPNEVYSLYADHKEEHVIVKNENSNRTYDEVNSDKTFLFIKDNFGSSRFGF